jgi:hypothetical protein
VVSILLPLLLLPATNFVAIVATTIATDVAMNVVDTVIFVTVVHTETPDIPVAVVVVASKVFLTLAVVIITMAITLVTFCINNVAAATLIRRYVADGSN